jgi:queuine tRNA-ribosyltransferase
MSLKTRHGELELPTFLPDGTRGVVRTLDASDLADCGVSALMVNALHLSAHPGASLIHQVGGIHRFIGWDRPIASDSGGFQVLSLIGADPKGGRVTDEGFTYRLDRGAKKRSLTPEACIRKQMQMGADILFCLDHCTHPKESQDAQAQSVDRTIEWARRCKAEFARRMDRHPPDAIPPRLFAVIQGGDSRDLRARCSEALLEIGFDGYGYGGWPIDQDGRLVESVGHVAEMVPKDIPSFALGIGKPENLLSAFAAGYRLFDCALPTRDARRQRLYTLERPLAEVQPGDGRWYRYLYVGDERYARDADPVDGSCDCLCCSRYSRAYLHHLFQIGEGSAFRLATAHNLRFYTRLMEHLRTRVVIPPGGENR